jgi:hypothetical protein
MIKISRNNTFLCLLSLNLSPSIAVFRIDRTFLSGKCPWKLDSDGIHNKGGTSFCDTTGDREGEGRINLIPDP